MIVRDVPPRALSWTAALVLMAFAGLLLPWLPALAQTEPEAARPATTPPVPPKPEDPLRRTFQTERAPDVDKVEAELKMLQTEVQRKLAELEQARARLLATRGLEQARAALLARTHQADEKRRAEGWGGAPPGTVVIRIEISGLEGKTGELHDWLKTVEKGMPGKVRTVHVNVVEDHHAGKAVNPAPGASKAPAASLEYKLFGAGMAPAVLAAPPTPPVKPAAPGRASDLDRKLDSVLKELEALRQELRGSRPTPVPVPGTPPESPRRP